MTATERGQRNFARENQARHVANIATKLRDMADEVDRAGRERPNGDAYPPGVIAGRDTHIVAWGVANLNLETLVTNVDDVYEVDASLAAEAALINQPTKQGAS